MKKSIAPKMKALMMTMPTASPKITKGKGSLPTVKVNPFTKVTTKLPKVAAKKKKKKVTKKITAAF